MSRMDGKTIASRMLLLLLASTGWFVLSTTLVGQVSAPASMASVSVISAAIVWALTRRPGPTRPASRRDSLPGVFAGGAAFGVAPLLVAANRFSDAPPGSEVLLLTTTLWALLAVALVTASALREAPLLRLAAAAVGLVGATAIVTNLERPSSFSAFVRYPNQDVAFVLAGVAFAAGVAVLGRAAIRVGTDGAARSAALGAAGVGILGWGLSGAGGVQQVAQAALPLLLTAAVMAVSLLTLTDLSARVGPSRAVLPVGLVPAALVLISPLERGYAPLGPTPLLWAGVGSGAVLLLAGAVVSWLAPRPGRVTPEACGDRWYRLRLAQLGSGALLLPVAAWVLSGPALAVEAGGVLDSGDVYRATWEMRGVETVGAWLLLAASLTLIAAWFDSGRGASPKRAALLGATLALVCLGAYPLLRGVPLRTWNEWVPVDIQQAYGTEYAKFQTSPVPLRRALIGLPRPADARIEMGAEVEFEPATVPGDVGPVGSLEAFAPDDLTGWDAEDATALSANSLSRIYIAADGTQMTVAVEQFRSAEAARGYVDAVVSAVGTSQSVDVGGTAVTRAEDGGGGASAGWVRSSVAVVVEVVAASQERAAEAMDEALEQLAR